MADKRENANPNETVLVAHVTVHLSSGQAFELLPFMDAKDVKSKVTDLIEEWAKSGFLVRGSQTIPWHQVQWIEATQVEELMPAEAKRRLADWNAQNPAQYQQALWKTREARAKKDNGKGEDEDHESQRAA